MYNQLLLKAFEKAGQEVRSGARTRQSQQLSDYIQEDSGDPYGEKSLRNHYKAAKAGKPIDLKNYVVTALCHYLGYDTYEAFLKDHPKEVETPKRAGFYKRNKTAIVVGVLCAIVLLSIHYGTQTRWMVWQEDHYMEAAFDEQLLQNGALKLFKEDRIKNFRKINPDCDTRYKSAGGKALLWYGKNATGELEYFTSHGLHPETGKTLKEMTPYMFEKYICP